MTTHGAETAHLALTPQQLEELGNLVLSGPVFKPPGVPRLFPLSSATITFDHYPMLFAGQITSGTDLTKQSDLFSLVFGVTFSCIPTAKPVYAVADFSGRSGNVNVLSLNNFGPSAGENDWTNVSDGTIIATFDPPIRGASIDAIAGAFSPSPNGEPYIQAIDSSGNEIHGARATYPAAGWAHPTQTPNPVTGAWETLTIPARPQADIHQLEISLTNSDCCAVFDNLGYER